MLTIEVDIGERRALLRSKFDSCRRRHDRLARPGLGAQRRHRRPAQRRSRPRPIALRDGLIAVAPSNRTRSTADRLAPDLGSATVEFAAAIPLLLAVTLAMVGLLGLGRDQVLAQGAAREAAREAAIGGDLSRASLAARAALPAGGAAPGEGGARGGPPVSTPR